MDFEFEINHVLYAFTASLVWLLVTIWGNSIFQGIYDPVPISIIWFIRISYTISAIGLIGAIIIALEAFEVV